MWADRLACFGWVRILLDGLLVDAHLFLPQNEAFRHIDARIFVDQIQNTAKGSLVGEARCNSRATAMFREYLEKGPENARISKSNVYVYPDTKIKFHFSDFRILVDEHKTCFDGPELSPHLCGVAPKTEL